MRIDPKTTVVPPVAPKTVRDTPVPPEREGSSAAVVELSSAGTAMVSAKEPDAAAKVARLRELISKGEYRVDLDELAARLCEDEIMRGGDGE